MIKARINERITATRVRLILPDGTNLGEVPKYEALRQARDLGLDLVEVSQGNVPVCKVMDYGKHLYEKKKAEQHQTHAPNLKEMRIKYNIGEHDLEIKKRKIAEFLQTNHKVAFSMQLKGRERFVAGGLAKQKFIDIVRTLVPAINPSEIKESGSGFTVLLDPSRR